MTEEEIANSYIRPRSTMPRRSKWRSRLGVLGLLLFFFVPTAGCIVMASMPWWIPALGVSLGSIIGLAQFDPRVHLPRARSGKYLLYFVLYIGYRCFFDFLFSHSMPHTTSHLLFDLGMMLSIVSGTVLGAVVGWILPLKKIG